MSLQRTKEAKKLTSKDFQVSVNHNIQGTGLKMEVTAYGLDAPSFEFAQLYLSKISDAKIAFQMSEVGHIQFGVSSKATILQLMVSSLDSDLVKAIQNKYVQFEVSQILNTMLNHNFNLAQGQGRSLGEKFGNKRVPAEILSLVNKINQVHESGNGSISDYRPVLIEAASILRDKLAPPGVLGSLFGTALNQPTRDLYDKLLISINTLETLFSKLPKDEATSVAKFNRE